MIPAKLREVEKSSARSRRRALPKGEIFDLERFNGTDRVMFDTNSMGRLQCTAGRAVSHLGEDVYEDLDFDV